MRHHSHTPDGAEAVRLVFAGRRKAFLVFLRRCRASVLGPCRRILDSESEAQVVAQEATLQAFLGLETLREPAQFGAWLHSTGANLARYRLRQKRRRPLLSLVPPEQVPQSALQLRIPELVARFSELGGIGTDTGQEHLVCELPQDHPGQGSGERKDGRTV
jgi:DNA-directed RNA polymerase specialized sigma24 family protein